MSGATAEPCHPWCAMVWCWINSRHRTTRTLAGCRNRRDHWPRAFSNIWAGGGIDHGKFIGGTDKRGEDSIERICGPGDFLATIYHHLGIDSANTLIKDFNGRPTPIVDHGKPIPELMG